MEVLHKIMEGETIYTESEIEILKSIMLLEASDSKKIYGKTGTGTDGIAWFIGFVEKENTNIYKERVGSIWYRCGNHKDKSEYGQSIV